MVELYFLIYFYILSPNPDVHYAHRFQTIRLYLFLTIVHVHNIAFLSYTYLWIMHPIVRHNFIITFTF